MEDAPEMEPMMAEEQPMMEPAKSSKKSSSKKSSEKTAPLTEYSQKRPKDILQPCCCCLCACSNVKTDGETCCGCFPIKCGVTFIGITTLTLATVLICYNFFLILNDYMAWYYPVVILVLYVPLFIACCFFVVFFTRDKTSTRGKLNTACMFVIISVTLKVIWTFIYIYYLYKQDVVYLGINEPEFHKYIHFTKKYYIWLEILYGIIIVVMFAYFMCVVERYYDLMKPPTKEEAKSEKSKSSKKSSKKSGSKKSGM